MVSKLAIYTLQQLGPLYSFRASAVSSRSLYKSNFVLRLANSSSVHVNPPSITSFNWRIRWEETRAFITYSMYNERNGTPGKKKLRMSYPFAGFVLDFLHEKNQLVYLVFFCYLRSWVGHIFKLFKHFFNFYYVDDGVPEILSTVLELLRPRKDLGLQLTEILHGTN